MKRIFLAFFVIICFVLHTKNVFAQHHHNPNKAAILQVIKSQQISWNSGDIEGFMKGYWNSPELRFVGKSGIKHGWQKVLDNYKKNYDTKEKMGELFFDITSTEMLSSSMALVVGKWKVVATEKTSEGYFTLWFKKIDGKWLIVLDHTS